MRPEDGEDLSTDLPDFATIEVDLQGLSDFAQFIRGEVEENLRPYATGIIADHSSGVVFGGTSRSGDVQAARQKYQACLTGAIQALNLYVEQSEILISAASKIANEYATTDVLASARAQQIQNALLDASAEADAARAATEQRRLEQQAQQVAARLEAKDLL